MESHATDHRRQHTRHQRRVEAIDIKRDVVIAGVGNTAEHIGHTVVVNLIGGDDVSAIGLGGAEFFFAGAAGAADAEPINLADVRHLRGAADRAADWPRRPSCRAGRNTKERDVGLQVVEVFANREIQKAAIAASRRVGQCLGHDRRSLGRFGGSVRRGWKGHRHGRSRPDLTFNIKLPIMGLDQRLDDG